MVSLAGQDTGKKFEIFGTRNYKQRNQHIELKINRLGQVYKAFYNQAFLYLTFVDGHKVTQVHFYSSNYILKP